MYVRVAVTNYSYWHAEI